jgi:hypothetical protein
MVAACSVNTLFIGTLYRLKPDKEPGVVIMYKEKKRRNVFLYPL